MFSLIKPGTNIDFMGKAPFFLKLTFASLIASVIFMFVPGIRFGLDFSGGYEMLLEFSNKSITSAQVRAEVQKLGLGDTSVQSYADPSGEKELFLVRVQRATALEPADVDALSAAFTQRYGAVFKGKVGYNPEIGNVVDVPFTRASTVGATTDEAGVRATLAGTKFEVRQVRSDGRQDTPTLSVVIAGIDRTVVAALQQSLDPAVNALKVDYVGPTVGQQLREDGILAVIYALIMMLVYIAFRFDFYYAPGAVLNVFHDAIVTVGFVVVVQRFIELDFNLATVASILTLIGYSINDTIIVYDRIRETVGQAEGGALDDILNRSVNETLARTVMTSSTVFLASVCLMIFGRGTLLFDFGLIMAFGVVVGTYSSIYVAAPIFKFMRQRFGAPVVPEAQDKKSYGKSGAAAKAKA